MELENLVAGLGLGLLVGLVIGLCAGIRLERLLTEVRFDCYFAHWLERQSRVRTGGK